MGHGRDMSHVFSINVVRHYKLFLDIHGSDLAETQTSGLSRGMVVNAKQGVPFERISATAPFLLHVWEVLAT